MVKKMIALIAALVMIVTVLTGCQSAGNNAPKANPAEVVPGIMTEFEKANEGNLPVMMELDAETLQSVYAIDPAWLDAYVCRLPMMNVHATEFFIAHVKDGHMDDVKAAIEARQKALEESWSTYLPEQYDLVKASVNEVSGNYILFAVTEHQDSIKEIFTKAVK